MIVEGLNWRRVAEVRRYFAYCVGIAPLGATPATTCVYPGRWRVCRWPGIASLSDSANSNCTADAQVGGGGGPVCSGRGGGAGCQIVQSFLVTVCKPCRRAGPENYSRRRPAVSGPESNLRLTQPRLP